MDIFRRLLFCLPQPSVRDFSVLSTRALGNTVFALLKDEICTCKRKRKEGEEGRKGRKEGREEGRKEKKSHKNRYT